jgi:subtilisin family serine protease
VRWVRVEQPKRGHEMASRLASDAPTFRAPKQKRLAFMPGKYFVRVHPDAVRPHVPVGARAMRAGGRALPLTRDLATAVPDTVAEPLDYLRDNLGLKSVRPLFDEAGRTRIARASVSGRQRDRLAVAASVAAIEDDELAGIAIAELDPKASKASIRRAESAQAIDYIEPVPARWLARRADADARQNLQWGLRAIRWFEAERPDAGAVSVGILDTGIDAGHPDLKDVDIEYHHPGTRATDIVGHGTHVAGIVAADANNNVGIAGVASCAIQMWKVFQDEPWEDGEFYVDPDLMADSLREASLAGLAAVNLSLGGTESSRTEALLIRRLLDRGVAVVAAMGNEFEEGNPTEFPAAYDDVLAVGAIAEDRRRSSFSNTGSHTGICAPGSHILSTVPRRASWYRPEKMYASWDGTSMAAPHVAAAAALVKLKRPQLGARDVQDFLKSRAARLPAMGNRRRTSEYGAGLLDLKAALS